MTHSVRVKSRHLNAAEMAWFAPICNGDFEYLGVPDNRYKSNWENTSNIVKTADRLGYRNILCPSSYQVGQDTLPFVSAMAPTIEQMNMLAAVRCGEIHPPMLARTLATIDHILKGKLTINIISSNLPGEDMPSADRYQRSREVIEILKQIWNNSRVSFQGQFYDLDLPSAPGKPFQQNGGPLLYFGGYSPYGLDLCAEHCDVYLMWPDTEDNIMNHMSKMTELAQSYDRTIDYGLRVHVIVRETETEAKQAAKKLMSKLSLEVGENIKNRALDAKSLGVAKQNELRDSADDEGFVEAHLWTGIGRARSGCGAAIVGDPDQVLTKIHRYMEMGIRSFIFSGYPHLDECRLFAKYVLPHIETISFPQVYGRVPVTMPNTPLAGAQRV